MTMEAMQQLSLLHLRELVRDRRYFWFAFGFPFVMYAIFLTIARMMPRTTGEPDFTTIVVPVALFLAVTGSALTMTAGQLAGLRSAGTLRLLGTTPLTRGWLIGTHVLPRIAMLITQSLLLTLLAIAFREVTVSALPGLLAVTLLGWVMFLAIGYLIGGRLRSPEAATNLGTFIQLSSLFLSGLAIPLWMMPATVANILGYLPTTFYANLLQRQVPGGRPTHAVWTELVVVLATTAVATVVAVRTFRWDDGERA